MGDTNNWPAPKAPAPGEEGYTTSSSLSFQEREKGNAPNADASVLAALDEKNPDAAVTTDSLTSEHTLIDGAENEEYVTGYKLALLLFSVTTFFFLLMLDMSIISTVSCGWFRYEEGVVETSKLIFHSMIGCTADHVGFP